MATSVRNVASIPLTAFDIHAVARVTGLSISQLQQWDRTGFFHPSLADPNRRRPGSRIDSRNDVIVLRIIAKLRETGVPLARLKPVLDLLLSDRKEKATWPACAVDVVDKRIYVSKDDAIRAANQSGQMDEPTTIDLASVIAEVEEAVERLGERRPEQIGQVIRKRAIMGGVPIIAGTRIPTETIAWFHSNGYPLTEILANFPRLTPRDIEAAVAFETEREANTSEPILVTG
jgi:uncharacterized protein (DUF433 family)